MKKVVGSSTISFRFNKSDETSSDVIYTQEEEETGILKSSYIYYYETEGNLYKLWESLNYDVLKATAD